MSKHKSGVWERFSRAIDGHRPIYTPAPWKISIIKYPDGINYSVKSKRLREDSSWCPELHISGIIRNGLSKENAQLISAAPEMLEALKMVKKYEPEYRAWGIPGYVNVINNAIAKAEGEC